MQLADSVDDYGDERLRTRWEIEARSRRILYEGAKVSVVARYRQRGTDSEPKFKTPSERASRH